MNFDPITYNELRKGGPPVWVADQNYKWGDVRRSPDNAQRYVRLNDGAGSVDPSLDTTNWRADGKTAIKSIQRGVITISGGPGVSSATATIASVDTSKTELRLLGSFYPSDSETTNSVSTSAYVALTNATTITATRSNQTPYTATHYASWELTEYF